MVRIRCFGNIRCILWSNTISKVKKKLPANLLSVEELLESLNNTNEDSKEEVLEYKNDVLPFLTHFNIVSGGYPVSKTVLYKLYCQWSKEPVNKQTFCLNAGEVLFTTLVRNKPYFLLNMSAIELSKKNFEIVKNTRVKFNKSPLYRKHFENFIKKFNLDKGEIYVPSYALYHLYDKWCYEIKRNAPLGYRSFMMFCSLYLKNPKYVNREYWYFVSKDIYKYVSEEKIKEIQEIRKEKIRKRPSKQKKQIKISGPKSNSKS